MSVTALMIGQPQQSHICRLRHETPVAACFTRASERHDKWLPYVISDSALSLSLFLTTCLIELSLSPRHHN